MSAHIATALVLAGLVLGQSEVTKVNSPIETVWGLSAIDHRPVEGGVEVICTIMHRGLPAPGMELDLSLLDEAGQVLKIDRIRPLSGEPLERIEHRVAIGSTLASAVRHIRAELLELKPDGSRQRLWSGADKTISGL